MLKPDDWPDWVPPQESLRPDERGRFAGFLMRAPGWWSPPPHLHDQLRKRQQWRTINVRLAGGQLDGGSHLYVTRWPWERICEAIGEAPEVHAVDDGDGRIYAKLRHATLNQIAKRCSVAANSMWCAPALLAASSLRDYHARSYWLNDSKSDCTLFNLDLSRYPLIIDPETAEPIPARRSRGVQRVIRALLWEHYAKRRSLQSGGQK
jgi:hypothetical protein